MPPKTTRTRPATQTHTKIHKGGKRENLMKNKKRKPVEDEQTEFCLH